MQYKNLKAAEIKLLDREFELAFDMCVSVLDKEPDNVLALIVMLRALNKSTSFYYIDRLQRVVGNFVKARAEKGMDTLSVWSLISTCNKYIMSANYRDNNDFVGYLESCNKAKREKTKLLILTCVWKRHDLTEVFYSYYKELMESIRKDIDLEMLVVGSEGQISKKMCEKYGFNYLESSNSPLSGKWQSGIEAAKKFDFDSLVIMGSDDFVSKEVFYLYEEAVKKNIAFFGFQDLYLYDVKSNAFGYWKGYGSAKKGLAQPGRVGETIGLGRLLSRSLLEYLNFNIWEGLEANKSLDGLMKKRIIDATGMLPVTHSNPFKIELGGCLHSLGLIATTFYENGLLGLDVKHSENVTSFEKYNVSEDCYYELGLDFLKKQSVYQSLLSLGGRRGGVILKNKKVAIGIPSYNRNDMLNDLVNDIFKESELSGVSVEVFVYDDAGHEPVKLKNKNSKYSDRVSVFRSEVNGGKKKYWKTVNFIFNKLSEMKADYYFYLPDDIRLKENFFEEAIFSWEAITDEKKISLNLLEDGREECWTKFKRLEVDFSNKRLYKSQWLDMAICFDAEFLRFRLHEIELKTWTDKPHLSSGVGAQLSKRFFSAGYSMYQVKDSLVLHGQHESKMNYEERKSNPLFSSITPTESFSSKIAKKAFEDKKVVAGVAVIESRWESLKDTVESIVSQVDKLYVYQNGFKRKDDFLDNVKIEVISSIETGVDRGDAGKFYMLGNDKNCIYFSIDDDLSYPPNYVERTLIYLASLSQPCIVSYHGRVLNGDAKCYYEDIAENYKCLGDVSHVKRVEFAGTGVMAFDTEDIKIDFSFFEKENMADVWMGLYCFENSIPLYVLPHTKNWILHNEINFNDTIFVRYKDKKSHVNNVIEERCWSVK